MSERMHLVLGDCEAGDMVRLLPVATGSFFNAVPGMCPYPYLAVGETDGVFTELWAEAGEPNATPQRSLLMRANNRQPIELFPLAAQVAWDGARDA